MRRRVAGGLVAALGFVPVLEAARAEEGPSPAARDGVVAGPFREDGAPFDPRSGTFGGERGDTGCTGPEGRRECLPSAVTSATLADGRVLYWNGLEGQENVEHAVPLEYPDTLVNSQARLLTLGADQVLPTWARPSPVDGGANRDGHSHGDAGLAHHPRSAGDLFCASQAHLADGRVVAVGGTAPAAEPRLTERYGGVELEGLKATRVFDPVTDTWAQSGLMQFGRWYPTLVTLADGRVLAASGVTKLIKPVYTDEKNRPNAGGNVRQTEAWDPGTGSWSLFSNGERSLPLYPRLHLLPNGRVYFDAAGQASNPFGGAVDEALWGLAAVFDPSAPEGRPRWRDLGVPGVGTATEPGFRGSTFSVMLPLRPSGGGAYPLASFLSAGGTVGPTPGTHLPTVTSRITTVDVAGREERLTTVATGPLGVPRWFSSGLLLPDGSVLASSGADVDEVNMPGTGRALRQMELFTPEVRTERAADGSEVASYVGGSWRRVASAIRGRTYHNTSVLLADGRVLVNGHTPLPTLYTRPRTLPGGFSNNFRDGSFEIYSPPYLFRGRRPVIGPLDPRVALGRPLTVPTAQAREIVSAVLVRNSAVTHLVDGDQRSVELTITARSSRAVQVEVPDNPAVLPPGPYLLFLNRSGQGGVVPSVARQVLVGAAPAAASGRGERATGAASPPGHRALPTAPAAPPPEEAGSAPEATGGGERRSPASSRPSPPRGTLPATGVGGGPLPSASAAALVALGGALAVLRRSRLTRR